VCRAADKISKIPRLTLPLLRDAYKNSKLLHCDDWSHRRCISLGKKRLLVFASDGALIPYAASPFLAAPSRRVRDVLATLNKDERNIIYIVSGRGMPFVVTSPSNCLISFLRAWHTVKMVRWVVCGHFC
jgi:hypothetical protein